LVVRHGDLKCARDRDYRHGGWEAARCNER
jgi:hypothetical protein